MFKIMGLFSRKKLSIEQELINKKIINYIESDNDGHSIWYTPEEIANMLNNDSDIIKLRKRVMLDANDYVSSYENVERIMKDVQFKDLEIELTNYLSTIKIEKRLTFKIHLNTVFLHCLLNRCDEFTNEERAKAISARKIINRLN